VINGEDGVQRFDGNWRIRRHAHMTGVKIFRIGYRRKKTSVGPPISRR